MSRVWYTVILYFIVNVISTSKSRITSEVCFFMSAEHHLRAAVDNYVVAIVFLSFCPDVQCLLVLKDSLQGVKRLR